MRNTSWPRLTTTFIPRRTDRLTLTIPKNGWYADTLDARDRDVHHLEYIGTTIEDVVKYLDEVGCLAPIVAHWYAQEGEDSVEDIVEGIIDGARCYLDRDSYIKEWLEEVKDCTYIESYNLSVIKYDEGEEVDVKTIYEYDGNGNMNNLSKEEE